MITHEKMPSMKPVFNIKFRVWAATSLIALVFVSSTNSIPVEAPASVDQASESDMPIAPGALLARYYGNPYSDEDELKAEKRTSMKEIEEGQHMARYIQKKN